MSARKAPKAASAIEYWFEQADPKGFGFACGRVLQDEHGARYRCGKKTYITKHIGGNDQSYPICEDCINRSNEKFSCK